LFTTPKPKEKKETQNPQKFQGENTKHFIVKRRSTVQLGSTGKLKNPLVKRGSSV